MNHDEFLLSACDRLRAYLERHAKARGLDPERIHCFDNEFELRWSDLNAVVITARDALLAKATS